MEWEPGFAHAGASGCIARQIGAALSGACASGRASPLAGRGRARTAVIEPMRSGCGPGQRSLRTAAELERTLPAACAAEHRTIAALDATVAAQAAEIAELRGMPGSTLQPLGVLHGTAAQATPGRAPSCGASSRRRPRGSRTYRRSCARARPVRLARWAM
jgi:hypothetical protein